MATLQQLRYLIAVAEYGSINAAARELFATQSNLSTAIKDLEQELGVTIFTRSNRGVALTNDGTELLGYARQVMPSTARAMCAWLFPRSITPSACRRS